MRTTYTPDQLLSFKLLIAEHCKDRILIQYNDPRVNDVSFYWKLGEVKELEIHELIEPIKDTEWSQIVNDVEIDHHTARRKIAIILTEELGGFGAIFATWPQRVDVMQRAEVFEKKG